MNDKIAASILARLLVKELLVGVWDAQYLVGYEGQGTKVHDSGMSSRSGRINKAGRRDLRVVLIEAAQVAT